MNINAIDIRQLRYFVAVAEELHFGRAAKRLNMSQPPLSQQIKALEQFLGTPLLYRTNRHVALTQAGQYLLPEARRLLREIVNVAENAKKVEAGITGHLRIGVNYSAPLHPMTSRLLRAFHKKYPHVRTELVLHERPNILQLADIKSSELDLALLWLNQGYYGADQVRLNLAYDEMQVVVPADHEFAVQKKIHIRDLQNLPYISIPKYAGTQCHDCTLQAFATIKSEPRIVYEVLQMPLVINMIAAGQGVSLLPAFLSKLPIDGVVFCPLVLPRGKPPQMIFNLVGAAIQNNVAAQNFIKLAQKMIQKS